MAVDAFFVSFGFAGVDVVASVEEPPSSDGFAGVEEADDAELLPERESVL